MIPASQRACVLVRDQVSMNCGRSAGTVEYPARPRISAAHIAITIAAEGTAGAELAEFTAYNFRLCAYRMILFTSSCGKSQKNAAILHPRTWHSAGMARLRVSIVFGSGARIGPGKAKLLESIRDTGSISAAARDMGMSYKRAWVLLDSINQAFTEPGVTAAPGGAGGGGAVLTPFGAEVLERYRRILDQAATIAIDDLAALKHRARPDAGPKV